MKYIDRKEVLEELKLRRMIQKAIKVVEKRIKSRRKEEILQEQKLRSLIQTVISETEVGDSEEAPHRSTGINVLEDLLKKIIPIIEIDFKKLTTSSEQRASFRSHVVQAVKNTLAPQKAIDKASDSGSGEDAEQFIPVTEQDINIDVGGDSKPDEFIDIDKKSAQKSKPADEKEEFGISGEDETGRDVAFSTFKRVEANIVDSWEILSDERDKELFFDYLITNLKLYFDKFEDELQTKLPEPTTPEYEREKESPPETGAELGI